MGLPIFSLLILLMLLMYIRGLKMETFSHLGSSKLDSGVFCSEITSLFLRSTVFLSWGVGSMMYRERKKPNPKNKQKGNKYYSLCSFSFLDQSVPV